MKPAKRDWTGTTSPGRLFFAAVIFTATSKFPETESIKTFGESFVNEDLKKIFDMNVVQCDEDAFTVEFNYCPLLAAWMKQTDDEQDIEKLCDIAMDGDRGIVETYPTFQFDLQSTLACGDKVCRTDHQ